MAGIFGDAKTDAGLSVIAKRRLAGNQIYTFCAMVAHNLSREVQMPASLSASRSLPKRPSVLEVYEIKTPKYPVFMPSN